MEGLNSDVILAYRYIFAALIYMFYILFRHIDIRVSFRAFIEIFLVSIIFMAPTAYTFMLSFNYIPTGVATSVSYVYPVLVAIFMALFFKKKLLMTVKIGIVLSVIGVTCVSWMHGKIHIQGILLALASAVAYAGYFVVLNRQRLKELNPQVLTFYFLVLGGFGFVILAAVNGRMEWVANTKFYFNVSMLAILSTILSSVLLIKAIDAIGPVITSVVGTLEPLTAVFIGVMHFGEVLDVLNYVGFLLIFISVVLVIFQKRKPNI